MSFLDKFQKRFNKVQSLLCVGLDPDLDKIQSVFSDNSYNLFKFCKQIIDRTYEFVLSYKINIAFFERFGSEGFSYFEKTITYLQKNYPDILIIADVKRGDLANTSKQYACYYFEQVGVDSVTLNPYMGLDSLLPFIEYKDKLSFILCFTSNPSSNNFQKELTQKNQFLYQKVANTFIQNASNIGLVVGGTHLEELKQIRKSYPDTFLLVPGIGFQGGNIEEIKDICGTKSFLNISRSIIFPQNVEKNYWESVEKKALQSSQEMKVKI